MKLFSRASGLLALLALGASFSAAAQNGANTAGRAYPNGWAPGLDKPIAGVTPILMNLWDKPPGGAMENAAPERDDGSGRIWNVSNPGLLVYLPPARGSTTPAAGGEITSNLPKGRIAIIECMGGSYTHLTRLAGGDGTAEIFLPRDIVVIALKYRLKPPSTNVEADTLADARRAMRLVRAHAREWNIDPHKVGMLGWSAGANLILNLATHPENPDAAAADPVDRESDRPDFVTLLSPWPDNHEISAYPAPKAPPPAFIGNARDDRTAPFVFAKAVEAAWQKAGGKSFFLEAQTGGHASFEIGSGNEGANWPEKFLPWLHDIGMQ